MSKRYHSALHSATLRCNSAQALRCSQAQTLARSLMPVITNDLFLAAFLHSLGCTLDRVERNDRRRVSFVFSGERVKELREAYRSGNVSLDIKVFRESMHLMRSRMDMTLSTPPGTASSKPYERSLCHARSTFTAQPQR